MNQERIATLAQAKITARVILECYQENEYIKFLPDNWDFTTISPRELLWLIVYTCEKRLSYQFYDNLTNCVL